MSRKVVPGWRYFECESCGRRWREACRDAQTLSSSDCFNARIDECENLHPVSPEFHTLRQQWPVDGGGNLLPINYSKYDGENGIIDDEGVEWIEAKGVK